MKKEYMTPVMVVEELTPDESVALGCKTKPDNPDPQKIQCYFYTHSVSWGTCTQKNVTKTVFMTGNSGCNIQVNNAGTVTTTSGIEKTTYDFVDGGQGRYVNHTGHKTTAYHWDTHWIREGQITALDEYGQIKYYFNS